MHSYNDFLLIVGNIAGKVIDRCRDEKIPLIASISFAVPTKGATHAVRVSFAWHDNSAKRPVPVTIHSQIINNKKINGSIKPLISGMYGCINAKWTQLKKEGKVK